MERVFLKGWQSDTHEMSDWKLPNAVGHSTFHLQVCQMASAMVPDNL